PLLVAQRLLAGQGDDGDRAVLAAAAAQGEVDDRVRRPLQLGGRSDRRIDRLAIHGDDDIAGLRPDPGLPQRRPGNRVRAPTGAAAPPAASTGCPFPATLPSPAAAPTPACRSGDLASGSLLSPGRMRVIVRPCAVLARSAPRKPSFFD